jgi:hypothetical protein
MRTRTICDGHHGLFATSNNRHPANLVGMPNQRPDYIMKQYAEGLHSAKNRPRFMSTERWLTKRSAALRIGVQSPSEVSFS